MSANQVVQAKDTRPCITVIGMAGAGKSTVGKMLALSLNWAFVDTDHIIEATYAARLQDVADKLTKDEFLDTEASIVQSIFFNRTVIATGGSVVYREKTMEHLAKLGIIVYLNVDLNLILERIAKNPERGLAIAPGQTIEDLFHERELLYKKYANITLDAKTMSPKECAQKLIKMLPENFL